MKKTRRNFIKTAGTYTLGGVLFNSLPVSTLSAMRKNISPNEKVNFGLIGCKGMGWSDMRSILKNSETDCIALCDIDDKVLEERSENVKDITGKKPKIY